MREGEGEGGRLGRIGLRTGRREGSDSTESEHKEGRCRRQTVISISLIGTISKHILDKYSPPRTIHHGAGCFSG